MNYKVIMNKNDFFKIHNRIAAKNLEIKEDKVHFEVELGSLNVLKESGYPYHLVDSFRIKLQFFIKQYYLVLVGVLFLFSVLYINSYRVNGIFFNINTPINADIENRIKKSYKRLFCFNFSNLNYAALSKSLRIEYVEYPYIEVYAKGNKILVDIYSYDDEYPKSTANDTKGDIIAKKDGVVDSFYVYSGSVQVGKNKYVRQGDVLVSGQVNDTTVSSKGLILAYTYEKVTIDVLKEEKLEEATGNQQSYFKIGCFGYDFPIGKKNTYEKADSTERSIFNLFDAFHVKKIAETEKNVIIKKYNQEQAVNKAQEMIQSDFESNKVDEHEKITDMVTYSVKEDENKYAVTIILKKLESIGEFKAL